CLVLGGRALRAPALEAASRIAARTGARLVAQYSNGRMQRGAGRVAIHRTPAPVDEGLAVFKDSAHVIFIGAKRPAAIFGHPGKPDWLTPAGADIIELTQPNDDLEETLQQLADRVGAANTAPVLAPAKALSCPSGRLTPSSALMAVAALMPDQAIIVDESI